ncbi:MAG: hypothetical protein JNK64_30780 [Myxococcales bacterium]|nr:hypothetical protein [Myxococcales bacterium]
MAEPIDRVTLFVPGIAPGTPLELGDQIAHEWVANDGRFADAFRFGTVGPDALARLAAAPGAVVAYAQVDLREGRAALIAAVERLRDAGAIAVRIEQSMLGWEVERWLALVSSSSPWDWHRAAVVVLTGDGALQSCGMHAFSLPDVRVELDDAPAALQRFAEALNAYQLAEDPVLRTGQTFRPDEETPRRVVERWPDAEYPPGHPCHNPYGVWRLGPAGGVGRGVSELVPVFVPALAAVLTALEAQHGQPLTEAQVLEARDRGACIMMSPRDAQRLERSRGYVDLEPELAWEQWQLVRARPG